MPPFVSMILKHTLTDPAYWAQCASAAVFTYMLLGKRKWEWGDCGKVLSLIGVFFAIHMVLSLLTPYFRFLAGIGTWFSYMGGVIFYGLTFCKFETKARLVTSAATLSIIITLFELGAVMGRFLEYQIHDFNSLYTKLAACVLLLLAGGIMSRFRIAKYYVSEHAVWLNLVTCMASSISVMVYDLFAVHVFPYGGNAGLVALMSLVLFALFIIIAACYFMSYHLSREYTMVLDLTAENQMNKSAQSLMAVTEENLAEFHKIQHDIQNQYTYIRFMMDSGDLEGLHRYVEEMTSTFSEPLVSALDCGNHTMNLIIHMESTKARKMGVTLDVKAAPPHELPFSQLDLVKLYTNLLDNAIEACVAEQIPTPVVTVGIQVVGEYLLTQIRNPTRKKQSFLDDGAVTTKEDTRIHGKGMSIVKSIVNKYNGSVHYAIRNDEFIVEFMLCLKEEAHD